MLDSDTHAVGLREAEPRSPGSPGMHRPLRHLGLAMVGSILAAALVVAGAAPALALSATPDSTWMTNGVVYTSVQVGNTLVIGGTFTRIQDAVNPTTVYSTTGLAAVDMTTGAAVPDFLHQVSYSLGKFQVLSLAVSADQATLFVGGTFDAVDGQPRANLAAIDLATGQLTSWAPVLSGGNVEVAAILATSTDVIIGGNFSRVDGKQRKKLARISYAGVLDNTWKPKADDRVGALTLAADGQSLFVGGNFESITITAGGVSTAYTRQSIARLALDTGVPTSWQLAPDSQLLNNRVHAIVATPTRLYLGVGAKGPNWVGAYNLTTGTAGGLVWKFGTVGNVQALALSQNEGRLFFGGHFGTGRLQQTVCGGTSLHGLAVINAPATTGAHSPDCGWVPQIQPFGDNFNGVRTLHLTSTYLWLGGRVDSIGGVGQLNLARFTL